MRALCGADRSQSPFTVRSLGLNFSNFIESLKDTPDGSSKYNPSSSFEYPLRWVGMESNSASKVATMGDLFFGYGASKLSEKVLFGQVYRPGVAALLQPKLTQPQTTVLGYTAKWFWNASIRSSKSRRLCD